MFFSFPVNTDTFITANSLENDPDDHHDIYSGPLEAYDEKVKKGELQNDDYQREIVSHLEDLHNAVNAYEPTESSLFNKVSDVLLL